MRAMVLAAGLGTRLRPITYEIAKPMVPVLDRPVMAHIVDLLERSGVEEIVANLHHFPDPIRDYFGERVAYRYEEQLLGTAGGVRNCADLLGDETFLVISGDALTDIDLRALVASHRERGAVATLAATRVADPREYGVVLHDGEGRISGFQEKPEPQDARSDLGSCGIYCLEPVIFDYFPPTPFVDWAQDVFPVLLAERVPFFVHQKIVLGQIVDNGALLIAHGGKQVDRVDVQGDGRGLLATHRQICQEQYNGEEQKAQLGPSPLILLYAKRLNFKHSFIPPPHHDHGLALPFCRICIVG